LEIVVEKLSLSLSFITVFIQAD